MKYHDPTNIKRRTRRSSSSGKTQPVSIAKEWPGGDIEQDEESQVQLTHAQLHAMSRRGLWGFLVFLVISIVAFMVQDFKLYETLSEPFLQILGCPPPAFLIHLALTGYGFTVIVPVLIRMATGANPVVAWHHLACRSVFYLFYLVSNALPMNFLIVFGLGVLFYLLEQLGVWTYRYKVLSHPQV